MKEPKRDCFAWSEKKKRCVALDRSYCRLGTACPFYKPKGTECKGCHNEGWVTLECEKCKNMRK